MGIVSDAVISNRHNELIILPMNGQIETGLTLTEEAKEGI